MEAQQPNFEVIEKPASKSGGFGSWASFREALKSLQPDKALRVYPREGESVDKLCAILRIAARQHLVTIHRDRVNNCAVVYSRNGKTTA